MRVWKKKYICDICKQIFLRRRYFVHHFKRHNEQFDEKTNNNSPLLKLLPINWKYIIRSYESHAQIKNNFTAVLLISGLHTSDQIKEWMKDFMNINKCNYILKHLDSRESRFAKSKHLYICQYLSRSSKNSCPSCIRFIVKRNWENSAYYGIIKINYNHSHSMTCPAILRNRVPSGDVQEYFRSMFENGFSPSQAFNSYKQHLFVQNSITYDITFTDRAICPELRWVYYFYQKILKEKNGPTAIEQMIATVRNSVIEFNNTHKPTLCYFRHVDENSFLVVIITPLMKRALQLPLANSILYIDYESNVSRFGLHVFLIFIANRAGGIPIGVIITSDNSELVISEGFRFYQFLIENELFIDYEKKDPDIIVTVDSRPLQKALKNVFNGSYLLHCVFYILESSWKWLCKSENAIDSKYRKSFYNYIQRLVYCTQPELLEIIFVESLSDANVENHKHFRNYMEDLYNKRDEWAVCLQEKLSVEEQNVKNIIENSMKVFKEKQFKKLKLYNPGQLLHFIVEEFDTYYKNKLLDISVSENINFRSQKSVLSDEQLSKYKIEFIRDSVVVLTNIKTNAYYVINKDVSICSCYRGEAGLKCKHVLIINYYLKLKNELCGSISEEEKEELNFIANGNVSISKNCDYQLLRTKQKAIDLALVSGITNELDKTITSGDLDFCNTMANIIEEEIIIPMDAEDDLEKFDDDADSLTDVTDTKIISIDCEKSFDEFQENISMLTNKIKTDLPYFSIGLESINKQLQFLIQNSDSALLSALINFGKKQEI